MNNRNNCELQYSFQIDAIFLTYSVHISQGSAATCLRRGEFVANLLPSPPVKKCLKIG